MTKFSDMRDFLRFLEDKGDLVRIKKEVNVDFEIAAYMRKTSDLQGPAFLFENVTGYSGWKVAAGLFAAQRRITDILGTNIRDALKKFQKAVDNPIKAKIAQQGQCQEVVLTDKDVDVRKIPLLWHSEKDGGPDVSETHTPYYITAGVQIAKNPISGIRGLGMHRVQYRGRDKLGISIPGERRIGKAFAACEEIGKPLDMAIVIGMDPSIVLGSVSRVPHTVDKLDIAGSIRGEPIELVKCKTIDVEVPANAEIVLETQILPNIREPEGAFGEFTGCYGGRREKAPVVKVKAITMRNDAIYNGLLTGMPVTEDQLLNWMPIC